MTRTQYKASRGQRIREKIIHLLGDKCAECGSTKRLEIDHPEGRDWEPRRLSQEGRATRYWREYLAGKLRVLCRKCNAKLGQCFRKKGAC